MDKNIDINEQVILRKKKVQDMRDLGVNPYPNGYVPKDCSEKIFQVYDKFEKEELSEKNASVSVAGRIMTKRGQGKAGFANLNDGNKVIQVYFNKSNLTESEFDIFKNIDLGDIIYVEGIIFKTNVGELTVRVSNVVCLAKSLHPLPEKYHGLTDKHERYRHRYVDLMVNHDSKQTFISRTKIISSIKRILDDMDYLEVETPVLQVMPGGAAARPFKTHHNTLDMQMYMRIAPELYLKQLVVGGLNRVYEIGKQFRNEGISIKHNPEFTTLELYEAYGDMKSMMILTENLIKSACLSVNENLNINYGELEIDLNNFETIHMVDLINKYTNVNFFEITDIDVARKMASENNIELNNHHNTIGHIINEFFEQVCEEKCIQPTFVYGHPIEISPLSRLNDEDSRFTDRFELFIGGREYANAFSELNDPEEQLRRFKLQDDERQLGNDEAHEIDYEFIHALEYGLAPTGGLGIGIDRLVMLLTNSASIRDVIFFPTIKRK